MDHSQHIRLGPDEMTPALLENAVIYGPDNEKIGTISHTHGRDTLGQDQVSEVVIDVGGFLGIGAKPVLVALSEIDLMRDRHGTVHGVTHWTKDHLKALPEHHH